ncbi:MAG: hypothetical protein ACPGVF_01100 [Flavobacteriaceae bacterium]
MDALKKTLGLFVIIFIWPCSNLLWGQDKLYGALEYQMPFKEALLVLKENKRSYQNISFGSGTSYTIRRASLKRKNNRLYSLILNSKKNLNLKQASSYLKTTHSFFEKEGFKVVYADNHWTDPLLRDPKKPCIRMVNAEKNLLIEMEPIGQGAIYNIYVTFYNYKWFVSKITGKKTSL